MVEPTLEEKPAPDGQEEEAAPDPAVLSQSSMQAVMLIHQQLCLSFARSLWYQQTSPPHEAKHYLSLFLSCYQTGSALVTHFYPLMGMAVHLLCSWEIKMNRYDCYSGRIKTITSLLLLNSSLMGFPYLKRLKLIEGDLKSVINLRWLFII